MCSKYVHTRESLCVHSDISGHYCIPIATQCGALALKRSTSTQNNEMTPAPSCRWGEYLVYTNIHEGQTCPVQRHIDVIQGAVTLLITVIDSLVFGCLRKYVEHTKVH